MNTEIIILVEEDYAAGNFSAYAPDFRLSAIGDTETEALACIKDLIKIEMDKSEKMKRFSSKLVSMQIDYSAVRESLAAV